MAQNKETITIVVNGTPVEVEANIHAPLHTVVTKALNDSGNIGQPWENWELRDAEGDLLDLTKKVGEFEFTAGFGLFLSLKAGIGG